MAERPVKDETRYFTYTAHATEAIMMLVALAMFIVMEGACYTAALLFLTHGLARGVCVGGH